MSRINCALYVPQLLQDLVLATVTGSTSTQSELLAGWASSGCCFQIRNAPGRPVSQQIFIPPGLRPPFTGGSNLSSLINWIISTFPGVQNPSTFGEAWFEFNENIVVDTSCSLEPEEPGEPGGSPINTCCSSLLYGVGLVILVILERIEHNKRVRGLSNRHGLAVALIALLVFWMVLQGQTDPNILIVAVFVFTAASLYFGKDQAQYSAGSPAFSDGSEDPSLTFRNVAQLNPRVDTLNMGRV
jgi:hypothetical protein